MTTATLAPIRSENFTKQFIHELRVKPDDALRVFLGRFELAENLKGFIIEVSPSTVPQDAVKATITRMDAEGSSKFFLDIVNRGGRSIRARIRQM